jgi:ElaB/YqjD/DUF883 family membrane-anchored ribosome-binding protein
MDEHDPAPMRDGDITPPPPTTGFAPAEPLKDEGVAFAPDDADTAPAVADPAVPHSATETIKAGAQRLTGQAHEQVRSFADQGKDRATGALDQVAQMLTDAAAQVDGKLGNQYGDYARQAAGHVSSLADQVRAKQVDEVLDDLRAIVRKSPGVAIGVSAAVGFALARVVAAGLEQRNAA